MKPSFALSLSSLGITLLLRASGGWRNIGTVDFDSGDLDAELAALRAKGLEFDSPMSCKLILPNDQIRYLTLETGDISDETRLAEMRLALADATPYELHELAFDVSADGTRTHAAAVAYETLQEAEHFAQMHGFNPVCFVACPDENSYLGEPFFGPAASMEGVEVTPDGIAVLDIGPAVLPEPEEVEPESSDQDPTETAVAATEDTSTPPDAAPADDQQTSDKADQAEPDTDLAALEAEAAADGDLEDELAPQAAMGGAESDALTDDPADKDRDAVEGAKPETKDPVPAPAAPTVPPAPAKTTIEEVTAKLSERAAQALGRDDLPDKVSPQTPTGLPEALDFGAVAGLIAGSNATDTSAKPAASDQDGDTEKNTSVPPAPAAPTAPPVMGFSSRRTSNPELNAEPRPTEVERPASRIPTLSAVRATPSTPAAPTPVNASVKTAPVAPPPAAMPPAISSAASTITAPVAAPAPPAAARPRAAKDAVLAQIKPKQIAVPANSQAARDAAAARAEYEADKSGKPQSVARTIGGKPKFLGLMLTSLLLLFMAVVAAVALWSDTIFGDADPVFDTPAPALLQPDALDTPTPTEPAASSDDAPVDETPASTQPVLSDAPDASPAPLVDVDDVAEAADDLQNQLSPTDTAVLDALQSDDIAPRLEPLETIDATLDADAADKAEQIIGDEGVDPEAAADNFAFLDQGALPDTADLSHRTTYAATGIWQKIPDGLTPDETANRADLDDVYVASIDKSDLAHDSIALPDAGRFTTDRIQNALSSPVPANSEFDLDARGLVVATPEGTLNPDGITVYLGRPVKVPPARPEAPPSVQEPEPVQIARIRPRPRPADLQDRAERARLGGLNLEELSKVRPRARPDGLQAAAPVVEEPVAEPEAEPVETTTAALPPATSLAVGSSVLPRARPANFQRLVARAQSTPQPEAPAVQAAAAVAPSIPSSASVAREATVANVIDLRKLNLIGISGSASDRRALVRMPSGRIRRVQVGDNIDGGRVTAIDNQRLLYEKRGRNHTLRLPNG